MFKVNCSTTVDMLQISRSTKVDEIIQQISSENKNYQADDLLSQAKAANSEFWRSNDPWDAWKLLMLPNVQITHTTFDYLNETIKKDIKKRMKIATAILGGPQPSDGTELLKRLTQYSSTNYFRISVAETILAINKYYPQLLTTQLIIDLLGPTLYHCHMVHGLNEMEALKILGETYETNIDIVVKIIENTEHITKSMYDSFATGNMHKDLYNSEKVMCALFDLDELFNLSEDDLINSSQLISRSLRGKRRFVVPAAAIRPEILAVASQELRNDPSVFETTNLKLTLPYASFPILCNKGGILNQMLSRNSATSHDRLVNEQVQGLLREPSLILFLTESPWAFIFMLSFKSPTSTHDQRYLQLNSPLLHSALSIIRDAIHGDSNFTTSDLHDMLPDIFWQTLLIAHNPFDKTFIKREIMPNLTNRETLDRKETPYCNCIKAGIKPLLIDAVQQLNSKEILDIIIGYFNKPQIIALNSLLKNAKHEKSCWNFHQRNPKVHVFIKISKLVRIGPISLYKFGVANLAEFDEKLKPFKYWVTTDDIYSSVKIARLLKSGCSQRSAPHPATLFPGEHVCNGATKRKRPADAAYSI